MLLAGTATAATSRVQPSLKEAAQRESATVPSSAPLDLDTDGQHHGDGVSIDKLAQAEHQNEYRFR